MIIYFTLNDKKNIKKNYPDLLNNKFAYIDIPMIYDEICNIEINKDKLSYKFILTQKVESLLQSYYNSKRFNSILYTVFDINLASVSNFKSYMNNMDIYFIEYILLDPDVSIDAKLYKQFDRIL